MSANTMPAEVFADRCRRELQRIQPRDLQELYDKRRREPRESFAFDSHTPMLLRRQA